MASDLVRDYYDAFAVHLLRDYLIPNRRIMAQLEFCRDAIPRSTRSILVVGCGIGQDAHYLASRIAPQAKVLGIDISRESLRIACKLHAHPNIEYRAHSILEPLDGQWEVIVFPDSFEHIPMAERPRLHETVNRALASDGKVLITCPSPTHQAMLAERGEGLQVVDEVVTLPDLVGLARDIGGQLSHYAMVSVWGRYDYIHAQIEREYTKARPITKRDRLEINRCRHPLYHWMLMSFGRHGLLYWPLRKLRVIRVLGSSVTGDHKEE